MKKKIVAVIALVTLVVGGGVATGISIYNNQPKIVARNAIVNFVKDLKKRDELDELISAINGGSLEFSASSIKKDNEEILDADISGKLYLSKDAVMLKNLKLQSSGINLLADAYLTNDLFYVSESEILNGAYGLVKGDTAKDFSNSIFAYGSGSSLSIPSEEISNKIYKSLCLVDDIGNKKFQKDAQKLSLNYLKELGEIVSENLEFEGEDEEVRLGKEKKNARVISIEIEDSDLERIIKQFLKHIKEDKKFKSFIEKHYDKVYNIISLYCSESLQNLSTNNLYNWVINQLDLIIHNVNVKFNGEIDVKIITPKISSKLLKLSVSYEGFTLFSLDLNGKSVKETDTIILYTVGRERVYKVNENTSSAFNCEVSVNDKKAFTYNYNKNLNEYSFIALKKDKPVLTVNGSLKKQDKSIVITFDSINKESVPNNNEKQVVSLDTDFKLIINPKDKIPISAKNAKTKLNYDRISNINEKDLSSLITNIKNMRLYSLFQFKN